MSIKTEIKPLFIIAILFFAAALLFQYKMIDIYLDFGREVSIPRAIIEGKVLYKDIFNLYGPFSYLFNAFFLKLFGVNLKIFNTIGLLNTYLIVNGIYFISRNFLNKLLSCTLALFVVFTCAFVPFLTNYITPYSYAMVFGLSAVIFAILAIFRYLETDKNCFLYLAYLLVGIAFANKFEYIFCLIPLLGLSLYKKKSFKDFTVSISLWALPTIFSYLILIVQGLRLVDYTNYLNIMLRYIKTPALSEFYSGTMTFSLTSFLTEAVMFVFAGLLFWAIFSVVKKQKSFAITALILFITGFVFYKFEYISTLLFYYYFPILLIMITLIKIKSIKTNPKLIFLIVTALAISIKSLWLLNVTQYGRYFLPLLTVGIVVVMREHYFESSKKAFDRCIFIILTALILSNFLINSKQFDEYKHEIKTKFGTIYALEHDKKIFDIILDFVEKNTESQDKIVVLRESSIVNFLTNRKTDDFYNHFEKVSFDAFTEDKIIKHYKEYRPDYFIIFTSETDPESFCNAYAKQTCLWLRENYQLKKVIKSEPLVLILRKI